ncbi:MAG: hypothetical protein R3B49_10850 [Phycisphaerales bacterium]
MTAQGLIFGYVDNVDEVFECRRTSGRATTVGAIADLPDYRELRAVPGDGLVFDYTMLGSASGAKLYLEHRAFGLRQAYASVAPELHGLRGQADGHGRAGGVVRQPADVLRESTYWNSAIPDGRFANLDEFSQRHSGKANFVGFDGGVREFEPPNLESETTIDADLDEWSSDFRAGVAFQAKMIYAKVGSSPYVQVEQGREATHNPNVPALDERYGWINSPRVME